jgi:hypothetical protein
MQLAELLTLVRELFGDCFVWISRFGQRRCLALGLSVLPKLLGNFLLVRF